MRGSRLSAVIAALPILLFPLGSCGNVQKNSTSAPELDTSSVITLDPAGEGDKTTYLNYTKTADLSKGTYYQETKSMNDEHIHSDFVAQVIDDKKITASEMNETENG